MNHVVFSAAGLRVMIPVFSIFGVLTSPRDVWRQVRRIMPASSLERQISRARQAEQTYRRQLVYGPGSWTLMF